MRRSVLLLSVAFATLVLVIVGGPVRAAQAGSSGWSVSPSPNPRAGNGLLNAVSCPTPSRCTAVGLHVRGSGLGVTLAEQRDGKLWKVQQTPNPRGAQASNLLGVSCTRPSACTAVGEFVTGSGAQFTLAERWKGERWRIEPTPNPTASSSSTLESVACTSSTTCLAVGTTG